jgi:DNA-binding response OmpR family regulator
MTESRNESTHALDAPPFASVVLVEDEPNLADTLKIALRKLLLPARHATTIEDARAMIRDDSPELLLLDRALPDGDGLQLCAELREQGFAGSILVLTASGRIEDRVNGLNAGADDYLPKPFSWEELEARIRALSRRYRRLAPVSSERRAALWTVDADRLRILGPQGWAELTPLEFKLATKLIQANGAIVTRDELLKDVWGFTLLPKTRTVDHFLGRLRKRFEQNPESPAHFVTARGSGYRFEP